MSPATERLTVQYVPLSTLLRWPRNPKRHDVGAIWDSIQTFGFRDPIAVNKRNNQIEEGHGRLDGLQSTKAAGQRPPLYVLVKGSEWLVPVLMFDDDEAMQERYAIAHNRSQERGGGYEQEILTRVLADMAAADRLGGTGFDRDDVDVMLRALKLGDTLTTHEVEDAALVTCPACGETCTKYLGVAERLTCPSCHARLSEAPGAESGDTVSLVVVVTPDERGQILKRLRAIQTAEALTTQGAALAWLCRSEETPA